LRGILLLLSLSSLGSLLTFGLLSVLSHGGTKLLLVNFAISILVDLCESFLNHITGHLSVLFVRNVSIDAGKGLIKVDSTSLVGVTLFNDVRWGWVSSWSLSTSLRSLLLVTSLWLSELSLLSRSSHNLGEFLRSILLWSLFSSSISSSQGLFKLVLINFSRFVSVNLWPHLFNHGFNLFLLSL
jgi:hypothetical protein